MKRGYEVKTNTRLVKFLAEQLAGVPLSAVKLQMRLGEVRLNGVKTRSDCDIKSGDTVEIFLPAKFDCVEIPVVYEDDNILIADKPAYVESEFQLPELLCKRLGIALEAAHRLDTNTTGLVVLCKNAKAKSALIDAFKNKCVRKIYRARVFGCPDKDEGRLAAYLGKNSESATVKVYARPAPDTKEIVTEYKVISRGAESVLELSPVTGRTHQLRAHMAYIGCPIVGDGKYGDEKRNRSAGAKVQQLRAVELEFAALGEPLEYLSGKKFTLRTID